MEWECTGDRQEYHTDGTLHRRKITQNKESTGDRQENHTDGAYNINSNAKTDQMIFFQQALQKFSEAAQVKICKGNI